VAEASFRSCPFSFFSFSIFFLDGFVIGVFRFLNKGIGMKLTGKLFNSGDDARSGPIHGVTDDRVTADL